MSDTKEQTFQHGDGCCEFKCTDGPIGGGGCCLMVFCPCFALQTAADQIGESGGLHCCMGFCGCACCSVMMLGEKVEEKRAIKKHDTGWHFIYSLCELCSCQSCRVTNECAVYAKDGAIVAPVAEEMEERK